MERRKGEREEGGRSVGRRKEEGLLCPTGTSIRLAPLSLCIEK
jgi:hypothetical protein